MIQKVLKRRRISILFIRNVRTEQNFWENKSISKKFSSIFVVILVYASAKEIRDKRVNFDDFETIKIIGRGAFGTVDLVRRKSTGQVYAMKTLSKFEMVKRNFLFRSNEKSFSLKIRSS